MPELLADVAVRANIPAADAVFTYRVPPGLHTSVRPGQLVWVPLRRQRVQGVILDLYRWGASDDQSPPELHLTPETPPAIDASIIRDLYDLADAEVALTTVQIRLARWLSSYYQIPLYEALDLMLPSGVAQQAEPTWRATSTGMAIELGRLPERERAVLYLLRQRGELSERDLRQLLRGSDAELRDIYTALQERGLAIRGTLIGRPQARPRTERMVRLCVTAAEIDQVMGDLARAPKQQAVLKYLLDQSQVPESDPPAFIPYPVKALCAATGAASALLHALERRRLIELSTREVRRDPLAGDAVPPDIPPPLTSAQEQAWRPISEALDRVPSQFLLHGVTGSGKTELYLRAIGRTMRRGKQALVLVPEIALTTQLVRRFAARFPGRLAVLHSGLSLGERYDEWRRLRQGDAMLAIGSRSAVFAPLPQLGLVIVDEEHEASYKHDSAPRYHARDVARRLAELAGAVLILGSATPAVESYADAQAGRLRLITLAQRVGSVGGPNSLPRSQELPLPPVRIIDMRSELQGGNRSIFSRALQQSLTNALGRHEQAILFLNRRGAAAFVMCRDCGHVIACPNCSSPLVVHYAEEPDQTQEPSAQQSELVCHSCNYRALMAVLCPSCWSPRVKSFGIGTQRVVEEAATLFPEARLLRWDRDSVGRKGDHARLLDQFLSHQADILVGTQMIAKGLDLPLVSVVGVVAADTGLHLPDFRSGERTFQLLTQVAGRAGRRSAGAQVILQTYTPDHYALRAAQEHDYHTFFSQEIAFRRQAGYPPFSRLVRFVYASTNDERSQRAAEQLAEEIRRLAQALDLLDWSLIGPAPAFFHRQRNRYRWHLLLRATDPAPLLAALYLPPGWSLDVDPVHVL